MDKHLLVSAIHRWGYCVALEVTNGLSQLSYKAQEALWGKEHIEALSGHSVDSGLIFFRNTGIYGDRAAKLDYLCQLRSYEPNKAFTALDKVLARPIGARDREIATQFYAAMQNGHSLDGLNHPAKEMWHQFRRGLPKLTEGTHDLGQYADKISQVKGAVVEEYTHLVFDELLPDAIKIPRYEYVRDKRGCDVDLLIIGEEKKVQHALTNPKYFIPRSPNDGNPAKSQRMRRAA